MSKRVKIIAIALLLMVSLASSFGAGCALQIGTSTETTQDLDIVKEAWDIIYRDYVDPDNLDATALRHGAIKGIVEALDDPHTSFLDAETYQQWLSSIEGKYEGIGAYVGVEEGQIVIIAPIEGFPAAEAGIKAGDIILAIDGKSALAMSLEEAVLHIRGQKGTSVRLLILHQGDTEPEEIEIVRTEIELPSINFEMRGNIAYIHIAHFIERTNTELVSVLQEITEMSATGIILDLRSNPGGLLLIVIDVADHFLDEGVILHVVDNQGKKTTSSASSGGLITDLPVIVLVDNYSASGSEVLAGALQDNGRAKVAGVTTYGKGSVNIHRELQDGSALYITNARWQTPGGRIIEGQGIEPDYPLELEGEDVIQWAIEYLKSNK